MKTIRLFFSILLAAGAGFAQSFPKETELELGSVQSGQFVLIPIEAIQSAAVLHWPNIPAVCPSVQPGEFLLPKVNPTSGKYLIEAEGCGGPNTKYNFGFVYEVRDINGAIIYMEALSIQGTKLKVRLTKDKPSLKIESARKRSAPSNDGPKYYPDGKTVPKGNAVRDMPKVFYER